MSEDLKPCPNPICPDIVSGVNSIHVNEMRSSDCDFPPDQYDGYTISCWECDFNVGWQPDSKCAIAVWDAWPRRAGQWVLCSERLPGEDGFCYALSFYGLIDFAKRRGSTFESAAGSFKAIAWYDGDPLADLGWEKK